MDVFTDLNRALISWCPQLHRVVGSPEVGVVTPGYHVQYLFELQCDSTLDQFGLVHSLKTSCIRRVSPHA